MIRLEICYQLLPLIPLFLFTNKFIPLFRSENQTYDPLNFFKVILTIVEVFCFSVVLAFSRSPSLFPSDSARITYIISALKGKALQWAQAFLSSHSVQTLTSQLFIQEFQKVFDHPLQQEEAAKRLLTLKQGWKSVSDHSIDFRILAEETGWDELAFKGTFTV